MIIQTIQNRNYFQKAIYFDMDGTIADLYSRPTWLNELRAERATPYELAGELCDLRLICELCKTLQLYGWRIGIVSWLAKGATKEYKKVVRQAKQEWLKEHFPLQFDELHFIQYGARKDYAVDEYMGILFDDDERVREKWQGISIDPTKESIEKILVEIISKEIQNKY